MSDPRQATLKLSDIHYDENTTSTQLANSMAELSTFLNLLGGELLVARKYTSAHPVVGAILSAAAQCAGAAQHLQGENRIAAPVLGIHPGGRA